MSQSTLGARGFLLFSKAAIVTSEPATASGEAAIEILEREGTKTAGISITTLPLTIAASLRKKKHLAPRVESESSVVLKEQKKIMVFRRMYDPL